MGKEEVQEVMNKYYSSIFSKENRLNTIDMKKWYLCNQLGIGEYNDKRILIGNIYDSKYAIHIVDSCLKKVKDINSITKRTNYELIDKEVSRSQYYNISIDDRVHIAICALYVIISTYISNKYNSILQRYISTSFPREYAAMISEEVNRDNNPLSGYSYDNIECLHNKDILPFDSMSFLDAEINVSNYVDEHCMDIYKTFIQRKKASIFSPLYRKDAHYPMYYPRK